MPAPLAPLVGFALGALLAWAAGEELSRTPGPLRGTRALAIVVLFAFLVFGPFAGYFVTYATDWSFAYLVDGRKAPSAILLLIVLLDIASVPLGFVAAAERARQRRLLALLPLVMVPLALSAALVAVFARRLAIHGTYLEVRRSLPVQPLSGSPVGLAVVWFHVCLVAALAWTIRELRRIGRAHRG